MGLVGGVGRWKWLVVDGFGWLLVGLVGGVGWWLMGLVGS